MTAQLPLWTLGGTNDAELLRAMMETDLLRAIEERDLIAAGEELLARLEAEKLRSVVQRKPKWEPVLPDFAI